MPGASATDLRIAGSSAEFNATGIVNGLTSTEMGAGWLLPRLIGSANSNDLLLTGRRVDAADALRMGLVSRVVDDDDLMDEARAMADVMAGYSHYGLEMTKQALWAELEMGSLDAAIEFEDRNQLMAGFTDNLPEAIRAFDQDRTPIYTDDPRTRPVRAAMTDRSPRRSRPWWGVCSHVMGIRVGVFGAGGRMGSTVCAAVHGDPDLDLVAAVDPHHAGISLSKVAGIDCDVVVSADDLSAVDAGVEVAIDFTQRQAAVDNLLWLAEHGIHAVCGTTGFTDRNLADIAERVRPSATASSPPTSPSARCS